MTLAVFLYSFIFLFGRSGRSETEVSLCSHVWPETHYVDQTSLRPAEMQLPLLPECWDSRCKLLCMVVFFVCLFFIYFGVSLVVREQPAGVSSLPPLHRFQGRNSGCQARWHAPAEPSRQPPPPSLRPGARWLGLWLFREVQESSCLYPP